MKEIDQPTTSAASSWGLQHLVAGVVVFIVGLLAGRALFPLEVPKPFVVEKEKRVEVPVERIVEKRVEIPVERIVEKRVEVPVEVVKYVERDIPAAKKSMDKSIPLGGYDAWGSIRVGMSQGEVKALLGDPLKVDVYGSYATHWVYDDWGAVYFRGDGTVVSWKEPVK